MIDLNKVILNSDGEPMKQNFKTVDQAADGKKIETSKNREVVLKDIIKVSLLKNSQNDLGQKVNDKLITARYQLWKKVQDCDEVDLNRKEIKLLKKLINQHYEILVAGQAFEILN